MGGEADKVNPTTEKQVGFLWKTIPPSELSPRPLESVARKLVYYMDKALTKLPVITQANQLTPLPDGFYYRKGFGGDRGFHICDIDGGIDCKGVSMGGNFDWKKGNLVRIMPVGIIHYMLDHNYDPGVQFRKDLEELPDPPEDFQGTENIWIAPNKSKKFQIAKNHFR